MSFFPESARGGRHELKVGTSLYWEHSALGKLDHAHGNYLLYFDKVGGVSNQPVEIEIYNYPFMDDTRATKYAAYLKDTWRITERVTANLGVRWERQHSFLPEQSYAGSSQFPTLFPAGTFAALDVMTWTRTVPRVGLAWDLRQADARDLQRLRRARHAGISPGGRAEQGGAEPPLAVQRYGISRDGRSGGFLDIANGTSALDPDCRQAVR